MELGEQPEDGNTPGVVVIGKTARLSVHEREESDRVALPDSTQRLAGVGGNRRDYEVKAAVAERNRGLIRAPEAIEQRFGFVLEPGFRLEVVDGDERASSVALGDNPVVAAGSDGRISRRVDVQVPAFSQETDQRAGCEFFWRGGPHSAKGNHGLCVD